MPSLREVQTQFVDDLLADEASRSAAWIVDDGLAPARRVQIYRNNLFTSLTDALTALYPVVNRLVGDDFFRFAAHRYIEAHPSRSGNLHDFGGALATFLETFAPARSLAYLPDVARLEWAWHRSYHSRDADPLDLGRLAALPAERYESIGFDLAPSARLLRSAYPVHRIWAVNQPDFEGDQAVDLDLGTARLLVLRQGLEVMIQELGTGEFIWLESLSAGALLGEAVERATAGETGFDLESTLRRHVIQGTLTELRT
jgi:hypothetical protein